MSEFTFLTKEQVSRDSNLSSLHEIGFEADNTDFSVLLGNNSDFYSIRYWTKTEVSNYVFTFDNVCSITFKPTNRKIGARIVYPYSLVPEKYRNAVENEVGFDIISFGEYPQFIAQKSISDKLNELYDNNQLLETGEIYTTDGTFFGQYGVNFMPRVFTVYKYDNSKYIRFMADLNSRGEYLSNSKKVKDFDIFWIKVEPIKWIVDKEADLIISENILFAGVKFSDTEYYDGDFENTNIKKFIDQYFSKEIMQCYEVSKKGVLTCNSKITTSNPYNFSLDSVSEEEIISGSIESDIPVFLHGPSSEGKSARVLEIDKDATIIYLANESPDTINGKSVYNEKNNEMIDIKPSWLVKLEDKCKDGKLHILFFDEITNAFPRVQGIVFNIILNREVNGKWKLPDNARIVAAGNEMEDSLSANELSEPLFNRFAHVYIKTTTESWLKWASAHNIHPAIYSFIAYKNGSVLRSKYDGKKVNADPRKWEMSSKMLYKTNNPSMLRSLIGEDITKEFIAFCSSRVITLEDVLSDNYSNDDIESLNTAEKYATIMGLSMVNEENVRKVRDFIKNLNSELLKVFDNLWANTEERLEILSEIELENVLVK